MIDFENRNRIDNNSLIAFSIHCTYRTQCTPTAGGKIAIDPSHESERSSNLSVLLDVIMIHCLGTF